MAVTLRSTGQSPGVVSASCVITKPAGLAVGDLMIAQVYFRNGTAISAPDGSWNLITNIVRGTTNSMHAWWKIATSTDVAASSFTFTNTSAGNVGQIFAFSAGFDTTTPIGSSNTGSFGTTTPTISAITPANANATLLTMWGAQNDDAFPYSAYAIATSNPGNWQSAGENSPTTPACGIQAAYSDPRPQTTSTGSATATPTVARAGVGILVSINPVLAAASPLEGLTDDFNDNSLDAAKWTPWSAGMVNETGQTLQIQSATTATYKGMDSASTWSLTGSFMQVEVQHVLTGLSSSITYIRVQIDDNNGLTISSDGTTLFAKKQISGTSTQLSSTNYSATTHRWWRFRESGGTVYYEVSPDGFAWLSLASLAAPFSLSALTAELGIGTDAANATTDTAIFDNFNVAPAFELFSDNFNDNSLDASKWAPWSGGDVTETSQTLQIQSSTTALYKGMNSAVKGSLIGSYVHVEVPHVLTGLTSASTMLQVGIDDQHTVTIYVGGTTLAAEYQVNGTFTTPATTPYNATAHRWWRIRESSGTVYYEYSADGSTWSVLSSVTAPFSLANVRVSLFIGTDAANATTDTAIFDNLNVFPVTVIPRGQYQNDQKTPVAIGGNTTDGITNNFWLETDAYADAPGSAVTLSVEARTVGTSFTGTATASKAVTLKQANLPNSRRGSAMVYDAKNKRFIVFGGYDGSVRYNEVWELSADSAYHRWKKLTPTGTPPVARNLCASTYARGTTSGSVDKAYMVIWGGADPGDRNDMLILDVSTPGSEAWTTVTQTNAPSARDYITHHMAAKVTASNTIDIYLFGGWASSRVSDLNRCTLNVNSPGSVTWTTLKTSGAAGNPSIRSGAAMIYDSLNNRLIITSGFNNTTYLSDVWQYSISSGTFTQLSPTGTAPGGRELPSVGYDSVNQRLILIGGWQGSATSNRNDVVQLSLVSGSEAWTQIKSNDTSNQGVFPFSNAAAAVDTNRNIMAVVNLYGYDSTDKYTYGFDLSNTSATASVYSLTVADYFRARDAPAFVYNSARQEFLLINGYSAMDDDTTISNGEHISEIWAYNKTNQTWRYAARGPLSMTQCEGGFAVYDSANDRVIFFGGLRGTSQMSNDVWELKADAFGMYKATKLSPSGTLPAQRWLMAGCYDAANHRMVIWGGQNNSTILGDVWALDLTSGAEAWTQLSPTGTAPTAAWQCAYAYDSVNKRLYVHGGQTGASYTSQLFYLDLSTTNGAWVNTGVTGGLAVRGAVMGYDNTSQRLVCFGGFDGTSVNDTVRYTSTSSFTSWTTQATSNTPAARRSAGAAMMGRTFVVSCGRPVSGTWFNDVKELDMATEPASWFWTARTPKVYQPVAIGLTGLAEGSYHWRSWLAVGATVSPAVVFGGNSESSVDFMIGADHTGQIKVYNGSSWVWKAVKVYNGSSWVAKTLRYWDGSTWHPYAAGPSTVAIDAVAPGTTAAFINNNNTLSWTHTCSGTNRYLVVGIVVGAGQTSWTTSVTCNGNAMTSLGRQQSNNQNDGYVELFGIIPPAGSCTIVATGNNNAQPMIGGSISATGVDQTSPVRTYLSAYGDGTSIQVTPTGASGDLFIDAACCGSGILTSAQTLQTLKNYNYSTAAGNMAMSTAPGAASAAMGYTCEADWWGIASVALRASGT